MESLSATVYLQGMGIVFWKNQQEVIAHAMCHQTSFRHQGKNLHTKTLFLNYGKISGVDVFRTKIAHISSEVFD